MNNAVLAQGGLSRGRLGGCRSQKGLCLAGLLSGEPISLSIRLTGPFSVPGACL